MGASVSAIPQSLYDEIKDEIAPVEIEPIDVTIQLANRDTICPVGIVRDVEVLCGKRSIPLISSFLLLHKIAFVPSYLVDPSSILSMLILIVRSKLSLLPLKVCHMSSISLSLVDNS